MTLEVNIAKTDSEMNRFFYSNFTAKELIFDFINPFFILKYLF